jgi:DNA mismatch repair protein MutS2
VRLPHLPAPGKVIDVKRAKGTVRLEVQGKVVSVPVESLEEAPEKEDGGKKPRRMSYGLESGDIASNRLDIRGQRADEAASQVEKFLDGAWLAGLESVEILHGKGMGLLKNLVDRLLEEHPGVKGGEPAASERGGHGVTVVKMK